MTESLSREQALRRAADLQRRLVRAETALRVFRDERSGAVRAAVRAGASYVELAQALGVSKQTIWEHLKRLERDGESRPSRAWLFQRGE